MINIAIDGPSGAGKSTLAKSIASQKGYIYVDTGALYRAIGLYIYRKGIDPKDADLVIPQLKNISLELQYKNGIQCVILNKENVSNDIRLPDISMYASAVSAIPAVRDFLLSIQRTIAANNNVVMDGRDIGTVILPRAQVKIFLTASLEGRARRRFDELCEKGIETTYEEVLRDMAQRDRNDSTRAVAPAVAADDAVLFDNTGFTPGQSLEYALKIIDDKIKSEYEKSEIVK